MTLVTYYIAELDIATGAIDGFAGVFIDGFGDVVVGLSAVQDRFPDRCDA